jgi:aspartyl-tRNA(Asn)/glutamyl-tRNA(Gln) amidotransferase subunit C
MSDRLTLDEVRHVARLARLRLSDDQLQQYRSQLSTVLDHIAKLNELDVDGVEPMAHPGDLANRLDDDTVGEPLDLDQVLAIAPAIETHYLAVPKVLTDETSS